MMRTPWNPPELAETYTLRRKTADGWEQCSAQYPNGTVSTRHLCEGATRALFLAVWGGGIYECTFHKANGLAAGRCTVRINLPSRPAAATQTTMGEVGPEDVGDADEELQDEEQDEGEDEETEQEEPAPAAVAPSSEAELRRELAQVRGELARAKRASGESLRALPPRKPIPEPPAAPSLPFDLPGEAGKVLTLYFHLEQIAVTKARFEIERMQAMEDQRIAREDARHRRDMEEQEARHLRGLEVERSLAERASRPRDQLVTELRRQVEDLNAAPEPMRPASPVEVAIAQGIPMVLSTLGEILKSRTVPAVVAAALPAATG